MHFRLVERHFNVFEEEVGEIPGRDTRCFSPTDNLTNSQTRYSVSSLGLDTGILMRILPEPGKKATVSGKSQSADFLGREWTGQRRISQTDSPPGPPRPRWNLVKFDCYFNPSSIPALELQTLFERLTAIV